MENLILGILALGIITWVLYFVMRTSMLRMETNNKYLSIPDLLFLFLISSPEK